MSGKILVVDDDPQVLKMMVDTLEARGYATAVASDGEQALKRLDVERFDVVVSDLAMPTMNGLRLLEAIRARELGVPVIIVSGFVTRAVADEALAKGAWAVLDKPLRSGELIEIAAQAMRGVA